MTPDEIRLVRRTWARVVTQRQVFGLLFYQRLFKHAPETRVLFPRSLDVQGMKLFQTLNWIVGHLDEREVLFREAEALAIRHLGYGVEASDYPAVGEALLSALSRGLDGGLPPEEKEAWIAVYAHLSAAMIAAAYPAANTG